MEVAIYGRDGSDTGRKAVLDETVFEIEPNDHVIWLDVKSIQAHARQGTHKAKERSEVRGGGRKPWRQKGTGRARVGTIRSPLWIGGGTTFGPRVHKYTVRVNRKTKQLARRSALSYKAGNEGIRVVEDLKLDSPKTRDLAHLIEAFELTDRRTLIVSAGPDMHLYRSGRNIPKVDVKDAESVNTYDIMRAHVIIFQEGALEAIHRVLGNGRVAEKETKEVSE